MVSSAVIPNMKLKVFLQQAVPLFQKCKEALADRDWATLRKKSVELQAIAGSAAQVMIEVQAQLLEQAAAQGQLHRASYLLLRIKNGLAMVLAEFKGKGGFADSSSEPETLPPPTPLPSDPTSKPLGQYLVEAQLLTPAQIDVALADQKATGARLGEILSTRGWIKQGTIEFLMQKVVIPDRQSPSDQPESASAVKSDPVQDMSSRATWVDGNKSTYIY